MAVNKAQYTDAKETLEAVQRLPVEAQQAILTMLRGATVISDMYLANVPEQTSAERPGA